jgi:acyl carrier protein
MKDNSVLINEIKQIIASEGLVDMSCLTPDATIASLGIESTDIVMILTAIEAKYNIYIPIDDQLNEAQNIDDVIAIIVKHVDDSKKV